jgi:uncharacterized protein with predicted RNA binding PUA domain
LNPLPIDTHEKISHHVDALFGQGISRALPLADLQLEFSRRTGRIKNFSIDGKLVATLRTDGGLALTIFGAQYLLDRNNAFSVNCVAPVQEAVPFVSEGRSLFCRHVDKCGSNIKAGSDVAIVDGGKVIAVGVSLLAEPLMKKYTRGVAVKVREGLRGRLERPDKD